MVDGSAPAANELAGLKSGEPLKLLTKEDIMQTPDRTYEYVTIPEWKGRVRVRSLSAQERDNWEASFISTNKKGVQTVTTRGIRASLVQLSVVDEKGALVFSAEEIGSLNGKNAAAVDRIYDAAARLSGITDDDIEEIVSNSGSVRTGASSSE